MIVFLVTLNTLLLAYLFALSIRIVLSWFAPQGFGKVWEVLRRITDPYLSVFYRLKFLRKELFDFTPIAAVLALVVALDLVNALLSYGRITLGIFLASLVSAAWSGARFLLIFFFIVGLIRLIPFLFRGTVGATLWKVIDMLVEPAVAFVTRLFKLGGRSGYFQYLLFTLALLLVVLIFGEWIIGQKLTSLISLIPF